jgi:hypothetical protein
MHGTSFCALLQSASRLTCQLSDNSPVIITVEAVGYEVINYLGQRYSGANEESSVPMHFRNEYMRRGTPDEIKNLAVDALCSLFRGLAVAVQPFPQWGESTHRLYRASFAAIDQAIQNSPNCPGDYQILRESLLNWPSGCCWMLKVDQSRLNET